MTVLEWLFFGMILMGLVVNIFHIMGVLDLRENLALSLVVHLSPGVGVIGYFAIQAYRRRK